MIVAMAMAMMRVAERGQADDIDDESQNAYNKKFVKPDKLGAFSEPAKGIEYNLYADQPTITKALAAARLEYLNKISTHIRKIPLAKPDKVSIFPYPYGKFDVGCHLLITAAARPTAKPKQSNSICILSLRSPSEPVTNP